jgi:hypothetical protein
MSEVVEHPKHITLFKWMRDQLKNIVWVLWMSDILVLSMAMLFYPEIFDYVWSKMVFIAAAIKSVLLFLGIADKDKLVVPLRKIGDLVSKQWVQGYAIIYSAFLLFALVYLLTNPPGIVVKILAESEGSQDVIGGKIELLTAEGLLRGPFPLKDTVVIFEPLKPFTSYTIKIQPDITKYAPIDSQNVPVRIGTIIREFQLKLRLYPVQFLLTPASASLVLTDSVSIKRLRHADSSQAESLKTLEWVSFPAGKYHYRLDAKNYHSQSGVITIPKSIGEHGEITLDPLTPKTVAVSVIADRGLGKTRREIPGIVRIKRNAGLIDSIRTGKIIALQVGQKYTVIATAQDSWDLARRLYSGRLDTTIDERMDTIRVKVTEISPK